MTESGDIIGPNNNNCRRSCRSNFKLQTKMKPRVKPISGEMYKEEKYALLHRIFISSLPASN